MNLLDLMSRSVSLQRKVMMKNNGVGKWNNACTNANANTNRLADKYHVKHVHQAMEDQYKEMGMMSVVFVCYTWPDGKLAIDV